MLIRFVLISVLAATAAVGWHELNAFSSTPGLQGKAPARWPQGLSQALDESQLSNSKAPVLIVFVHPRCSCTRATLEELDAILDSQRAPVHVVLAVYRSPALAGAEISSGRGQFSPAALFHHPFHIVTDDQGALARQFGVFTSGEAVLYSPDGRLLFQGGITPQRASTGDSPGAENLRDALASGAEQNSMASVFGCPLFSSALSVAKGRTQ